MVDKEVRKIIREIVDDVVNKYENIIKTLLKDREVLLTRIESFEASLSANQKGLQNDYDEFSKLTDSKFLIEFNEKLRIFREEIVREKKDVSKRESFMERCYKKMTAINNWCEITNCDPVMIEKIATILKVINDVQKASINSTDKTVQ